MLIATLTCDAWLSIARECVRGASFVEYCIGTNDCIAQEWVQQFSKTLLKNAS